MSSKITVKNMDNDHEKTYDYSKNNWANRWACMKNGRVHMWVPQECKPGQPVITSGRRWEIRK